MFIRQANVDDAHAIAEVHVRTWQSAYRGQLPDAVLDGLVIDEWAARWQPDGVTQTEFWVSATLTETRYTISMSQPSRR